MSQRRPTSSPAPSRSRPTKAAAGPTAAPTRLTIVAAESPTTLDYARLSRAELQALAGALEIKATLSSAEIAKHATAKLVEGGSDLAGREAVRVAFELIDTNGDGTLSRAEVIKAVRGNPQIAALVVFGEVSFRRASFA